MDSAIYPLSEFLGTRMDCCHPQCWHPNKFKKKPHPGKSNWKTKR